MQDEIDDLALHPCFRPATVPGGHPGLWPQLRRSDQVWALNRRNGPDYCGFSGVMERGGC